MNKVSRFSVVGPAGIELPDANKMASRATKEEELERLRADDPELTKIIRQVLSVGVFL